MKVLLALALLTLTSVAASPDKPAAAAETIVFAAGGDMIGPWKSLKGVDDAGFRRIAALFQQADVGFANQEGSIFNLTAFGGYPAAENGGGTPLSEPAVAGDIRAMGIRIVSKANNHATDWGAEGLAATLKCLSIAGIAQAGAGMSDAEARSPAYIETPKGTVALVSTASTFTPASVAGPAMDKHGTMSRPRPGISVLRVRHIRFVSPEQISQLLTIAGPLAFKAGPNGDDVRIGDDYFRASAKQGTTIEANPEDIAAVLAAIREARGKAQFVIFAIHAHETAGNDDDMVAADFEPLVLHRANEAPSPDDPRPADFEPELFHAAIDAGADVVVRTGPHVVNGIEIYKGKPIFYGLGSLFLAFGGERGYTAPAGEHNSFPNEWFETVIPVAVFSHGLLRQIKLYPAVIESSTSRTDISIEDSVGIIRVRESMPNR
jgi:poly-gamma-glutamate capsule biosynthesis protein CapA/YwtB (metallophosphatase superfamily)